MSHVYAFFMHTYHFFFFIFILLILICVSTFLFVPLFLSFFLSISCSMAPKRKSTPSWNPLRSGAASSFVDFALSHVRFHDEKASTDFLENFSWEAFIWNAKSFYWTFPILTFPLSSTVGVGSHCMASRSLVSLWSYRSFTPICMDLII